MNFRVFLYSLGAVALGFCVEVAWAAAPSTNSPGTHSLHLSGVGMARVAEAGNPSTQQLHLASSAAHSGSQSKPKHTKAKHSKDSQNDNKPMALGSAGVSKAFLKLDKQSEAALRAVLDLGSDLEVVQAHENTKPKAQVQVMVVFNVQDAFELDGIDLRIDEKTVSSHRYSDDENRALKLGGSQRLYQANLPAGTHELHATLLGKIPRDPDYRQDTVYRFTSGKAPTIIKLNITNAAHKGIPTLVAKEWQ